MEYEVPILRPKLPSFDSYIKYLEKIDQSRIYSNRGPLVRELEFRYSELFGTEIENIVLLANATLALTGLIKISGIENWVCPNFTFAATASAVYAAGKQLHVKDVDANNWQLKPPENREFNNSIFGYLPVMPFGAPVPLSDWVNTQFVIFDAAASLGSQLPNLNYLNETSSIVYSLHATKFGGIGEGSVVVCGNRDIANRLRLWLNFGFDENRVAQIQGQNAKLPEYSAAVALASLDERQKEIQDWKDRNERSHQLAANIGVSSITSTYPGVNPYWIAQFQSHGELKDVMEELDRNSIQARRWWPKTLSEMPAFGIANFSENLLVSKKLCETTLGLPMFRDIQLETLEKIANLIAHVMSR
jgi:dTDP-4-amino-4,6-dideoxygalactose transaminase